MYILATGPRGGGHFLPSRKSGELPHVGRTHVHSASYDSNAKQPIFFMLGDPEVTANLYCNFAYPYWEGCVICSICER